MGAVTGNTSLIVQAQYESNPYPRWQGVPGGKKSTMECFLQQKFPAIQSTAGFAGPVRMLIAGCGTGQEAIYNQHCIKTSEVLAIDLSLSSLAYAIRRAQELGISDAIQFRQADILQLGHFPELQEYFDVICCGGVLHHLENPMEGWKILSGLLRPGGIMLIALYSELGRRPIAFARERIAGLGIPATPEGIRAFRNDLLKMKYTELADLQRDPEIYSMSNCRDLLFHPQEWRYTLEQLKRMLAELELDFVGFYGIDKAQQKYRMLFPGDPCMTNLENWSLFERQYPGTFRAMYQFCVRNRGA
jgi:SAM-dependent methyltransferase